jgi:hypothetical protein
MPAYVRLMEPKEEKAATPEHADSRAPKSRWFADLRTSRVAHLERRVAAVEDSAEESDLPFTD